MNRSRMLLAVVLALLGPAHESPAQSSSQPSSRPSSQRARNYADGVRIDWNRSLIELDATVCLRQGSIELFACSPHTKEHESIVVLHARPLHVFEALGLIGLEPGSPPRYDPATDRSTPASGAALRIDVTVNLDGKAKTCGLHQWMRTAKDHQPMTRDWVFAGSRKLEKNRFAADGEGTLICVVDFDTAMIAMPESHTSDDADLWLEADSERIPPRGTKCLVSISSADRGRTVVQVDDRGSLSIDGRGMDAHAVEEQLRRALSHDSGANLSLRVNTPGAMSHAMKLREAFTRVGLTVYLNTPSAASGPSPGP